MQAIHTEVLKRINSLASSVGAAYVVELNGELHGPMADRVLRPKVKTRRSHVKKYDFVADTGYDLHLRSLQRGQMYECLTASGEYGDHFVKTLRAWGNKHWGRDKFIVAVEARDEGQQWCVQVLRVE